MTYIYFDHYNDNYSFVFQLCWWHCALLAHLVEISSSVLVGSSGSSNAAIVLVVLFTMSSLRTRWCHAALWRSMASAPCRRGCDLGMGFIGSGYKFLATFPFKAINKNTVIKCILTAIGHIFVEWTNFDYIFILWHCFEEILRVFWSQSTLRDFKVGNNWKTHTRR